ncbi:MAG: serine/threonine-protein kinase, partial [Kiritimatiellae bacterium]|nr:serine/threonine-protein kinase [Kiritimatiellia bacterium]
MSATTAQPPADGAGAAIPPHPAAAHATGVVAQSVPKGACPNCGVIIWFTDKMPLSMTSCSVCGMSFMVPGMLDDFLLIERIGVGEMGEIFRARDETLGREVAIKVVRAARADEESLRERLRREAQAAAKICHPRVAQVHKLGFSNGHPYLVMELVQGENLDVRLRREGRIPERVALRAAEDVTVGLQALHKEGLTHGDIKPSNILMDREGAAKLVDFGLSGMSRRDGSGAILGTPHYIAPESLRGAPDNSQTDIYSLGATLYHLMCGRTPFEGATPAEVVRARLLKPPDPIGKHAPHLSAGAQRIVMRMLERDPAARYPDSVAATADIRLVLKELDGEVQAPVGPAPAAVQVCAPPAPQPQPAPSPSRLRRTAGYVILSVIAVTEVALLLNGVRERAVSRHG